MILKNETFNNQEEHILTYRIIWIYELKQAYGWNFSCLERPNCNRRYKAPGWRFIFFSSLFYSLLWFILKIHLIIYIYIYIRVVQRGKGNGMLDPTSPCWASDHRAVLAEFNLIWLIKFLYLYSEYWHNF